MRQPPGIAAWLLKHFGGNSGSNEALLGDVHERYQEEQSTLWYWRQTIAIVCAEIHRRVSAIRRTEMKTIAVWSLVLIVAFGAGFWAGRIPSRSLKNSGGIATADPEIAGYVNRVAEDIVKNSDGKAPTTFEGIQSNAENATALPGAFFYFNTGLIIDSNICGPDRLASSINRLEIIQRINCAFRTKHN